MTMPDENSNQHAYAGTFRHFMDSKHRVTIPARWRQEGDEEQFYLMPSPDGIFLYALPPSEFQKGLRDHQQRPAHPRAGPARFARHFFSQAQHCVVDRQGRLLLPDEFRRQAGLEAELVLVGTYDRFEVWNPDALGTNPDQRNQHLPTGCQPDRL